MKKPNTYSECLEYLYGLQRFGIKLGFGNINYLLKNLNAPHEKFKSIHIAGTNGKGSVVAFISSVLIEHGYKVGVYTSPHLVDYCERITVNNKPISQKKIVELTNKIIDIIQDNPKFKEAHPTYFEVTTAQAFQYFAEKKIDFAVVEVGMGGRLDATNVITPELSIITSIGFDHTEILGDTLAKIAAEKAGIIKPGVPVVIGDLPNTAKEVVLNVSKEKKSTVSIYNKDFHINKISSSLEGNIFDYFGIYNKFDKLAIALLGEHQFQNVGIAIAGIEVLAKTKKINLNIEKLFNSLHHTYWQGRMEIVSRNPYIMLDGAHNPDAAEALKDNLKKLFPSSRIYLIICVLKDKEVEKILKILCPLAYEVIVTTISYERASTPDELFKLAKKYNEKVKALPTIEESINYAKSCVNSQDLICITGSLYVVGEAISVLGK